MDFRHADNPVPFSAVLRKRKCRGMANRYETLSQLRAGGVGGETGGEVLWIDNDSTHMYVNGEKVFDMHPDELLEQALDLLCIPHEHV